MSLENIVDFRTKKPILKLEDLNVSKPNHNFMYKMSPSEEYALNFMSRYCDLPFNPLRSMNDSLEIFLSLEELGDEERIVELFNHSEKFEWYIDDLTSEDIFLLVYINLHGQSLDFYNKVIEKSEGNHDFQSITKVLNSYAISCFFEQLNGRDKKISHIHFPEKRTVIKQAIVSEDVEMLNYLSQRTLYGFSETRLIGDTKVFNL